jgi:hypothetical protein
VRQLTTFSIVGRCDRAGQLTTRTFGSAILTFLAGLFLRRNAGWRGYDPTPITD